MGILLKHLGFVNEQIGVQTKLIAKFQNQDWRRALHENSCEQFKTLASDLTEADKLLDQYAGAPAPIKVNKLALTPQDVEGLPEELLAELTFSGADKSEMALIQVINDNGGIASLDQILVGIFRKNGEIFKRSALTSKLYRMIQKPLIFAVPNKKGVYSTTLLSELEAEKLFGLDAKEGAPSAPGNA